MYACKILADSLSPYGGHRLTTFQITFPRIVLAEYNTHGMVRRNSASSRAIPTDKYIRSLLDDTFVPERFGINEPGMQSYSFLEGARHDEAGRIWLKGRDRAVLTTLELLLGSSEAERVLAPLYDTPDARRPLFVPSLSEVNNRDHVLGVIDDYLSDMARLREARKAMSDDADVFVRESVEHLESRYLGVHKQLANRGLETYIWQTVITTATEWSNFFALRNDPEAQGEIKTIAAMMQEAYEDAVPRGIEPGEWHLPLLQTDEHESAAAGPERWAMICAGRCARVSYLTHDGRRDPSADFALAERLVATGHMSPLEHVARPMDYERYGANPWSGPYRGFVQLRKTVRFEHDYGAIKRQRSIVEATA